MKEKIKLFDISITIILVFMIIINLILCINILEKKSDVNIVNNIINNNTNEEISKDQQLQSMGERDRMEFYFSEYATYIEDGEYEKAYDLLYPEFKTNYFPTLEQFEEYAKKTYPEFMTFSYNNIERQGYIYVLNIDIIDVDNKENKKSHRVVIQENDFNDFVLSFQVI